MAKTKLQKEQTVKQLIDGIKNAKTVVIAGYEGLKVTDSQELREKAKEENVQVISTKKTLLKLALEKAGIKDLDVKSIHGSVAVIFSTEDEVAPAKIVENFVKDHDKMQTWGGIVEQKIVDQDGIKRLALIPSKPELLAKLVGSLKSPISGLANVLSGNLRGLVNVLNAIKDNK